MSGIERDSVGVNKSQELSISFLLQGFIAICHSDPSTTAKQEWELGNPQPFAGHLGEFP